MKGLILCGGKGTRMRPLTHSLPKQLIPVANKPVIHYAIEAMKKVGIKEVGFVVSHNRELFGSMLGTGEEWGMKFSFIMQHETLGIAHAVLCAEEFIGQDDFLLYLGDNMLQQGLKEIVSVYKTGKNDAAIMVKEVPNPEIFGVAVVKGSKIINIVEKPKKPKSNLAVIGVYVFNKKVFEAAKVIKPSARGEYEITDTIMQIINSGGKVTPCVVKGWWKDTGLKSDMIDANRAVLKDIKTEMLGKVDKKSELKGKVVIGKDARITNSKICGPVIIGEKSIIKNSYIGPFTALGREVTVLNSRIENSIVMENTEISGVSNTIESSLIGRSVVIAGGTKESGSLDIALGDNCTVLLP